ncbi:WD-repeat-containing protein [Coprinopsis sp. MPI-PUGE-AT-0042]|nr:WD-repeat-containing protein [Coprinopsis sp. MPI-PUGE-AT-0042]
MSSKSTFVFPPHPTTARGSASKLSSSKDKVVYTTGKVVIVRDLKDPGLTFAYTGHIHNAIVARISPSGFYCASGDAIGTVRIWDIVGEEKISKGEYKVLGGRINDLSWDGESKRIIAVGDGREKFGHAFMIDSGSSSGSISGHSKVINAVSIRHQRPFRAATAGDDTSIIFHHGVPFKYDKTIKNHTRFVQDIQFSPNGDHFLSVGSDFKFFLYDGKTGETVAEVTDSPHKGSIMAASWSSDSRQVATSAADKTVKLWDVEAQKAVNEWTLGSAISDQQVGNTWSAEHGIVSLSLSGDLNVFDPRVGDKPSRVCSGPQASITSLVSKGEGTFLAGTADGRVYSYSESAQESALVGGTGHSGIVVGIAPSPSGDAAYSIGFDDTLREISSGAFTASSSKTSSQPKSLSVGSDKTVFVVQQEVVEAFRSNQKVSEIKTPFKPTAVSASPSGNHVAIGGEDSKVYLYSWSGSELKQEHVLEDNKGPITVLAFSPDGAVLAAGDSKGKIFPYSISELKSLSPMWAFHTARINALAWTADSQYLASGSLDTNVYVWNRAKPTKKVVINGANSGGVNAVGWLAGGGSGTGKLVSAGADSCVRVWEVKFPDV